MTIHQGHYTDYYLVHTTDNFVSDVGELLFVLRVLHVLDVLHGGVLVFLGQELGLTQSLGPTDKIEGSLGVPRLTEPPEDQVVELRELLASKQHGRRGQAQAQVCC